jgi:hypothetical protein
VARGGAFARLYRTQFADPEEEGRDRAASS